MNDFKRAHIVIVNLDPVRGSEISKKRPCLIISNDINNSHSETLTLLPITSFKDGRKIYPFEVFLPSGEGRLENDSIVKADQIRTTDKSRIAQKLESISEEKLKDVEIALSRHLGLRAN